MARILLIATILYTFNLQVHCQILRSPLGLLSRPMTEALIESPRNFVEAPRPYTEIPRNYIELLPEPSRSYGNGNIPRIVETPRYIEPGSYNIPAVPSTTIISDCTPSVCKNLANTINLMIVCHLLQNTKGSDEVAVQFAAPLLREIIGNPTGAISSTTTVSSLLNANAIMPNLVSANGPNVASNYIPSNLIAPNYIAPNYVAPNYIAPNPVAPCGNSPNNSALISSLLKLLTGSV